MARHRASILLYLNANRTQIRASHPGLSALSPRPFPLPSAISPIISLTQRIEKGADEEEAVGLPRQRCAGSGNQTGDRAATRRWGDGALPHVGFPFMGESERNLPTEGRELQRHLEIT